MTSTTRTLPTCQATESKRRWWPFIRHYIEMLAAMVVGMLVLGVIVGWLLQTLGLAHFTQSADLGAVEMALDMSLGMVLWMRIRRHSWGSCLEMSAVMFVPLVPLLPLYWLGAISGNSLMLWEHVLMLPLMLLVMLRRRGEFHH